MHFLGAFIAALFLSPFGALAVDSGGILQLSPSSLGYEAAGPGTIVAKDVEVVNRGEATIELNRVALVGEDADQFHLVNRCPELLFPGVGCTITVDFNPSRSGTARAQLLVQSPLFEEVVPLTGTYSDGVHPLFDPGTADFGISDGSGPLDLVISVGNRGTASLAVTDVVPPSPPFSVVADSCTGRSLPVNDHCYLTVRFSPEGAGSHTGTLSARYRGTVAGTATLALQGARTDTTGAVLPREVAPLAGPDLQISTSSLDFGPVTTGKEQVRQITVRNLGDAAGAVGAVTLPSEPFTVVEDSCSGRQIGPQGICRLALRFAPAVTGLVASSLEIPIGTQGEGRIALRGQGVDIDVPALVVRDRMEWEEDLDLPFGERFLGRSIVTTLTVGNIGSAPLVIPEEGVVKSLEPPFFLRADGCSGQSISPGGSCTLQVRFAPFTTGNSSDTFDIRSDDPRFPAQTIRMSGTGMIAPGNSPPSAPVLFHPDPNQTSLRDTVTFRWSRCVDPDGDQVFYQLFLSKTPDFSAVESRLVGVPEGFRLAGFGAAALALLAGAGLSPGRRKAALALLLLTSVLLACSHDSEEDNAVLEIGNLDPLTTYHWKVMSDDGRGGLAESEVRSFTTR